MQSEIIRFIIKKVIALLLAIALSPVVMAQDRNVRLDLFGDANVVGASYDARFKGDSVLGFAVGVGYGFGIMISISLCKVDIKATLIFNKLSMLLLVSTLHNNIND